MSESIKATKGTSTLVTLYPEVAATLVLRDGDPSPEDIPYASNRRMLWECPSGHRWEAPVVRRTKGHGCPKCAEARRVRTTAAEARPELIPLFDAGASGFGLDEVGNSSTRIGHFRCPEGHQWTKRIGSSAAGRCPECHPRKARKQPAKQATRRVNPTPRLRKGSVALSVSHPEIAKWWDNKRNLPFTPDTVSAGSNRKMWWSCEKGHSWDAPVCARVNYGCPVCYGRRLMVGVNDLATTHPEMAAEFDPENSEYDLTEVVFGTDKKLAWKCPLGHVWKSNPYNKKGCSVCAGKTVLAGYNDLASLFPDVAADWDREANDFGPEEVTSKSGKRVWWVCKKYPEHRWIASCADRTMGKSRCPECSAADRRSRGELEVEAFIRDLGVENVKSSYRGLIRPYEVDLYLPDHGLAVEFNGVFWHCDKVLADHGYHRDKWAACRDAGVQLITVWEDDWRDRRTVVKSMLAHKLGLSDRPRLMARKLNVTEVDTASTRAFLIRNHIQGFTSGSAYFGLSDPDHGLVAVSVWRRDGETAYLDRYATSVNVIGGMGRLLAAGKAWARREGLSRIVTFSDHAVSDGDLYDKLGFTRDGEIPPDYSYLVDGSRVHKFNYRKSRFRRDPDLEYREGLTERELAELNGLPRVYDSGKTRWTLTV